MLPVTILAFLAVYAAGVAGSPTGMPQAADQDRTIEELLAMDEDLIQSDIVSFAVTDGAPSTFPILCISNLIKKQ